MLIASEIIALQEENKKLKQEREELITYCEEELKPLTCAQPFCYGDFEKSRQIELCNILNKLKDKQ